MNNQEQVKPVMGNPRKSVVRFQPDGIELEIKRGETILDCAQRTGIDLYHRCKGQGLCTTCRVFVRSGLKNCTESTERERYVAKTLGFPHHLRLACQTKVTQGEIELTRAVVDDLDERIVVADSDGVYHTRPLGQVRNVAVMFTDIAGYTNFIAGMPCYDIIHFMNRYFQQMGEVVHQYEGKIIDYYGDGLLCVFGLNDEVNPSLNALCAAFDMRERLFEINKYAALMFDKIIDIRTGIAYGGTVMGNVGLDNAAKYTVVGDIVNLAARIEAYNKEVGTSVLVSHAVCEQAAEYLVGGKTFKANLRGFENEQDVYEVLALKSNHVRELQSWH
ncbi:adenylate/guanylate cyclase domain-containing protein [Tunicatimonas pelagia]|uniref:adenylate/guanylate cyclase domain-containing protein n=1 Tax=Tunicatimonas pelagia TaxID=931531 RepID=UPI002665FF53|nr:adenylate/guanylate cyclase domain-containing protein [Tunicatimonas pelagia]WKN44839.1 adenylate/guanylate cyclase domain-containing protein [Tunicatimonas pelagia]